ncbi:aspartyl/glutamyl-tRNA(Asn/Gln) amidotransferase subunit B [Ruminococcus sp. YE71]|uniref:Asp-tRNA(Asn)/Glu-tRNA(Gln) amidotransferase subunit GatB n=1 Tax=unclassified Ruminococcus TaxID=2608920 RepID=UPI0008910ED4|nr:aspartyl/glutamyl-tRNA(Asn/Gln) amidotransferase subunit B [Ruminococcus sp. YE78]SFW45189.1 aspartyl/glutamyl-tRNA(Asn/Gln) amidotransferase subunit B [Ruminococcus sp. YE71]
MEKYITVIGLEIHAELLTKTKIFCNCSAEFGGERNSRCCPVCTGMPGTLPVINQTAVEYAVKAGYAFGCEINKFSVFDRKNYFYPDLPKAYQISQLYYPIIGAGAIPIEVNGKKKDIRINHVHLEEDAGKLVHDDYNGVSLADYNRCGIPLIEIVSEPDMRSAEEAMAYVEQISLLLQYAGVCDCKMEQGSLRCDVNISIMKPGDKEFGTRAEIKNINSIKSVGRAIKYEERRQALLLEAGKKVVQETRRYDANRDATKSMRTKENAHDYRYFPEPDILQVNLTDEQLAAIKAKLPEMPNVRLARYTGEYKLSKVDAQTLVNNKPISDFFEEALKTYNAPKSVSAFILTEFMRRINLGEIDLDNIKFTPEELATVVKLADEEKISKNDAKAVFRVMAENGGDPEKIAKDAGYIISVDMDKVASVIDSILTENASQVQQYASGEKKVFGFIMGQCTKSLKGVATPKIIKEVLEQKLEAASAGAAVEVETAEEEQGRDLSKLTKYTNPDKYVPSKDGDYMVMVGTDKLIKEFALSDALNNVGKTVEFKACVHRLRKMAGVAFVVVRTANCTIQTVHSEACKDSIQGLKEGDFVWVKGTVQENPKDFNGVEIVLSDIRLISTPAADLPLKISQGKLNCSIDTKLDNRVAALRNPYERAIFKLQEGLVHGMHEFMRANGFTEIHTPKIVAQGAEGGANIFRLDYFHKNAFLNQSPQFYKQACVGVFDRVYEIAPVYRAEKHATSRHINEYIGLDFEMGYIDSMYDVMAMETAMLRHIMEYLKENYKYELTLLEVDVPNITEIPSIKFIDALTLLRGDNAAGGKKFDLDPEDEVNLGKYAKEKYNSDFIFVTHFPSSKPPFYAMNSREDPKEAYKFDLLFRGLEITSGGQRINDYQEQVDKMLAQGLDPADFESYLDAHKYGLPPHGGLGIGLERLLMKLLGRNNIRETSMFPRDINRLIP